MKENLDKAWEQGIDRETVWSHRGVGIQVCTATTPELAAEIVQAVNSYTALLNALKEVVANHCPNEKMFCGTCSPAREVIALAEKGSAIMRDETEGIVAI